MSLDLHRDCNAIVEVRGLRTVYGDNVVHDQLNLTVQEGEILSIVGGSGTGKTTLLRQIIGLETPTAGNIEVLGHKLRELNHADFRRLSRRWGMMFQAGALFSSMSVFDNVAQPMRELRALPSGLIEDVVMCRLSMVGLTAQDARKWPADLSGGMIKRVALARALALDPALLLLDEPTAGLDPQRADEFVELLRGLHRQLRFTVIMITHDLDTLRDLSTRVAVLAEKHVLVSGDMPHILQTNHPFIHEFFGGERGRRAFGEPYGKP